ncbi:non-canonical purine NTP pyrophosphatase [Pseudomonas viridiflava]|uniref:non-canonical purine NTP pyrophosphatase n=1 Tax=Pseudomonas viridiflava TaxID=33069 RepID=UPI0018E5AD57|nr:non-canonical purine NTP pyrophosphatase [Pseudomonas viridiflava]MBI6727210.1 non-canonical purine NTP pyrophosphatase [Pseudomonas viridiflava]
MIVVTSNKTKRQEYERFCIPGLKVMEGPDIREIVGTPDQIIAYKTMEAGEGRIVEDAIIRIKGEPIIDVKWKIPSILAGEYPVGTELDWEVRLGVMKDGVISLYYGVTKGTVCEAVEEGFGIDPVLMVTDAGQTLAALDAKGEKEGYSARRFAIQKLLSGDSYAVINTSELLPWAGTYQNE